MRKGIEGRMRTKDFFPSQFFDILEGEMSIQDVAKKVKCSDVTAVKNLSILHGEGKVIKQWKYGMWIWRKK